MYTRKNIHYAIIEKDQAIVKFYNENIKKIYLKSILRKQAKEQSANFYLIRSNDVEANDFEEYVNSFMKYCSIEDRRGNSVKLKTENPF